MPHLHLSLQAASDLILKRMKRRHLRADAATAIARARALRPGIAIGADVIAGFPTETEAAFRETLDFVTDAAVPLLHVFPYAARPGTPAARMPAVGGTIIKARAERLRAKGDAALIRHLDRQIGRTLSVLVEREGLGRAADFTEVAFAGAAEPGAITPMTVTAHDGKRALA